jgi:MinD-like ATPase involved in chromosome partitioning or flagellar assembly
MTLGLISFVSAKGSPGTTTTALLAAALWPRDVVLVDADSHGGDIALRIPRADGRPVDLQRGLLSLLPLARRELSGHVLHEHTQTLLGGIPLIAGISGVEQATAVGPLWDTLALAFASLPGADVLLDCGRCDSTSVHLPLLQYSDVVVFVLRPDVSGFVHTRERMAALSPVLIGPNGHKPHVGVAVVAPERRQRDVDASRLMVERDLPGVTFFGHIAYDSDGARMFAGEPVSRPQRTLLVRSGTPVVAAFAGAVPPPRQAMSTPAMGDLLEEVPTGRRAHRGRSSRRFRTGAAS